MEIREIIKYQKGTVNVDWDAYLTRCSQATHNNGLPEFLDGVDRELLRVDVFTVGTGFAPVKEGASFEPSFSHQIPSCRVRFSRMIDGQKFATAYEKRHSVRVGVQDVRVE